MLDAFVLCCNFWACKCACTLVVRSPRGGWGPSLDNRPPRGGGGPSSLGWGTTRGGGYVKHVLAPLYVFFHPIWVLGGVPRGLGHNLLMHFSNLGSSKMELPKTDFFDILTIQNGQISYVKHVLAPLYVFFMVGPVRSPAATAGAGNAIAPGSPARMAVGAGVCPRPGQLGGGPALAGRPRGRHMGRAGPGL